ncbi:MAG: chlorophyll synthesis pathway protein BchC [Rhodospirillales bacterium]|jgi:3-hydroxyethyl bacteriochlorophyllide a dehydrogenase|nr:chlorophyll synthesis pathway protein BchC [Rhodospirillales bacterium]
MDTIAVVLEKPEHLALSRLDLSPPGPEDVVVDVEWSGISTGTERLLWSGRMPPFPGLGYPLVPGYEAAGRVVSAGADAGLSVGDRVFVPGAHCFSGVRSLFGGAAARLVVPAARALHVADDLRERAVLMALAATAHHAIVKAGRQPDLIVGHGVLGRLLARLVLAQGGEAPTVWECNPERAGGGDGYPVVDPAEDPRRDYRAICDVSGDSTLLDTLIGRLAAGGEVVLAGFYSEPLSFAFPPAFMREARIRIAAEWQRSDLLAVRDLVGDCKLRLDGLITHCCDASEAADAYRTAFTDPHCLKMILNWSAC